MDVILAFPRSERDCVHVPNPRGSVMASKLCVADLVVCVYMCLHVLYGRDRCDLYGEWTRI